MAGRTLASMFRERCLPPRLLRSLRFQLTETGINEMKMGWNLAHLTRKCMS